MFRTGEGVGRAENQLHRDYTGVIRSFMELTGFNAETVRRLTSVTYRQLDYWDTTNLVRPSIRGARGRGSRRLYSFQDVVEVRVVAKMLASGVSLPAIRKAVSYLTRHYDAVSRPLAQMTLIAEGRKILVRTDDPRRLVDAAAGGQVVVAVSVAAIARELEQTVVDMSAPREIAFKLRGRTLHAVLTPDFEAGGFTIEVPELPGVVTEADTMKEARRMARDAASLWLDAQKPAASRSRAAF